MLALHQGQVVRIMLKRTWTYAKCSIPNFMLQKRAMSVPCWCSAFRSYHVQKFCGTSISQLHARMLHLSAKRTKLPFEVEANVKSDTLLYSYSNDQLFRMVTLFGIVQFIFWGNLAFFCYSGLDNVKMQEPSETDTWWNRILILQAKYKYRMAVACMAAGYLVMVFTWLYPQRCISQIKLLRGGKEIRLQTYTHFGRRRQFDVPLDHVSFKQSRIAKTPQISVKLKGSWFYYLLDNRSGHFHNPALFDHAVGLKRKF